MSGLHILHTVLVNSEASILVPPGLARGLKVPRQEVGSEAYRGEPPKGPNVCS